MAWLVKCCFCLDVRTGTIACGIYTLVTRVFGIVFCVAVLISQKLQRGVTKYYNGSYSDIKTIYVSSMVSGFVAICFSMLLVYGTRKNYRFALMPWLVWMSIEIAVFFAYIGGLVSFIFSSSTDLVGLFVGLIVMLICLVLLQVYMIVCVSSYCQSLKKVEPEPDIPELTEFSRRRSQSITPLQVHLALMRI